MLNQETAKAARTDSGYILRAPRRMRVADAVAQYMRVPMGAGNSVPWDPLVAPYVIEPMNCLASREYDAVIFVGPARTGKTIGLIDGWVIYNVICDPADMLIIQMTEEKAREHSKKRLARTFRVSPEVVSRLSPNKNDNNVYDRTFLAGNYLKIGWPSVNIMSSSDYKCVALTDYDRFPEDIDGEGDAFSLASKRTTTFMSSGMTLVESSPGRDVKDVKWRRTSPHEAPPTTGILSLYNRGDRRRWYWPCPHCGEYFQPCGDVVAGFRDIADPVLASEAAYIQCPSCSGRILPEQKRELNGRGVWLRDGESINADGSRYGDPRRSRIASFWMEGPAAAYQTLSQLVYKLLTAEQEYETTGSEETLKTVINTDWGLPYLPRASMEQRKSELLEQRAEPVPSRSVPDGVNFLVATVDVQAGRHRRFVVQVTGYGSRGERWIIDRYNITQSLRGDSDGESQRIDPASYSTAKIKIYAGNDARLNNGTFSVNELYGSANKPSKSDVGLGNVTNDAQVKKTGDTMTGDLTIKKGTPSVFLRADSGVTALRFYTGDNTERGIIYAGPNTDSLGEVRIRAKTAGGTSGGDLVVRHDGRVEVRDLTVAYKIKSRTIEIANTDTDSSATTLSIYGVQHTPLVLTRSGSSENVSIGFKLDNVNPKYLGIDTNGDLAFGESPDQKQNSKLITQAKLDKGLTIGGQLAFKGTTAFSAVATFSAGIAGAIEPENIDGQTVNLNNLTIIKSDAGAVKYYICPSSAGGANITNKPDGVTGNFLLRVESTRKVRDSDYANMQTLINSDTKRIYVRFVVNGNWTAWSQVVVSGWNQDVTVRSLTSTTPSKLGGGRIDVLGSTSDYGSMNCTVRGVDSTGTNSAWSVGTSESTGKMLFLKNHRSSAQVLLNGDDGAVQLLSGTVNGATAQALTINKDEVNSTADLVIRKQTGTGNRFALLNSGNSELPVSIRVWGSSTRQNVFEVGTSAAYLFYAQKTTDGQNLTVNGSVNCTTLNQSSDRRLKENIEIIDNATDAIRKINGYTYTLKENGAHCAGVIAQEVEEAIPEAVGSFIHYGEELQGPTVDGNELREETRYLNVDYAAVTGLLVQVARETDDRVTALEEENTTLCQNLATADTRISTLENQVSELVALVRQLTGSEH